MYGVYQDMISTVPYTDVDYKVFTDAARYMLNNKSPYTRHTYRYTPLLALLLTPNLLLHHTFGKFLFCLFDILVAIITRAIVKNNLLEYEYMKKTDTVNVNILPKFKAKEKIENPKFESKLNICMLLWLYNPMSIAISTRGNCDAIPTFLVLLTLYFLQNTKMYFVSGLVHGLSVYVRLYPLIYSLAMYIFLSDIALYSASYTNPIRKKFDRSDSHQLMFFKQKHIYCLIPNINQFKLVAGCLISLFCLIGISYYLYGYEFLYETYFYHIIRKDIRHNFSLYFYLQYLAASINYQNVWFKLLMNLPQLVLYITFSMKYGPNKFSLNFSVLVHTIVFVIFNSVLTSQYFVWIMAILPLCILQIKLPSKTAISLSLAWGIAQLMWLLPAYYLEFKGQNTFLFIWIQSVSFYCVNIAILGRLVKYFTSDLL